MSATPIATTRLLNRKAALVSGFIVNKDILRFAGLAATYSPMS